MATSGTNAFDLDVDEVIEESFERCGLNSRSGYDLKTARRSLNIMLAEWSNRGINLWTVELRTQTLTANTTNYTLGTDVIDILEAVVFTENNTSNDIEVDRISRAEYLNISNKSTERTPLLKQIYDEEWQRASEEDRPRSSFYATPERGYI